MSARKLHIELSLEEATQLLWLLNRSVATLQPEKWPLVADELIRHVEQFVEKESNEGV